MPRNWRLYESKDEPAVRAILQKQAAKLGRKFEMPDLLAAPYIMTKVHETDGVIDWAFTVEAEAEACSIGDHPLPLEEFEEVIEETAQDLKARGFKLVRSFVPSQVVTNKKNGKPGAMRRLMKRAGYTEEKAGLFTSFYRWL